MKLPLFKTLCAGALVGFAGLGLLSAQDPNPGRGAEGAAAPPPPHLMESVVDALRDQGRDDLADQLLRHAPPPQMEGPPPHMMGSGRRPAPDNEMRGTPGGEAPLEFLANARSAHTDLLKMEQRRTSLEEAERDLAEMVRAGEADPARIDARRKRVEGSREEYDLFLREWTGAARQDLPEVRDRLALALERLDSMPQERPGARMIRERMRVGIAEFAAFVEHVPDDDQELADGLREHLGSIFESFPFGRQDRQRPEPQARRQERIQTEIHVLQRRLDSLQAELDALSGPDNALEFLDSPEAGPMWGGRQQGRQGGPPPEGQAGQGRQERRGRSLPPLPPDWNQ